MEKKYEKGLLVLKGLAMGIAEVIPGVSGGTIAFITGIYEQLLNSIKAVLGPEVIRAFRNGGIAEAWQRIDGMFLLFLFSGMATGVISGVFGVSHLMEHYPQLLWSFFFGLIIASAIFIGRQVKRWGAAEIAALLAGTGLAFYYTVANPAQGSESLWYVFLSGVIAISALILPGISGSFVLLLLGMYTLIIPSLKNVLESQDPESLVIVAVFAVGCLLGLGTFARVLSWTLKRYHQPTMALLTGFMVGSLNKIWPWRNVLEYRINSKGEQVPLIERSVLPAQYDGDPMVGWVLGLMVAGLLIVLVLERLGTKE